MKKKFKILLKAIKQTIKDKRNAKKEFKRLYPNVSEADYQWKFEDKYGFATANLLETEWVKISINNPSYRESGRRVR